MMALRGSGPRSPLTRGQTIRSVLFLLSLFVIVAILSLSLGSVEIPLSRVFRFLTGGAVEETERTILLEIRLPRILLAAAVGASLSLAGVVFQALLRNPLAEPYILGISSGGAVGALIAIGLFAGAVPFVAPVSAFAGCAAVMALVYALGHRHGRLDTYALLLAGVMVGAFFNAVVLVGFSVLNQEIRTAFLWLMGNLSGAKMDTLVIISIPLVLVSLTLIAQARTFNLIATGDETAAHLGVEVDRFRRLSYLLASLLTGVAVSLSGVIGFVGLLVPHACRIVLGPDHRLLLPASFLTGGSFLMLADLLSRTVIAPTEIPVGAVTAAIGAPLFIYLLKRQ